MFGRASLISLVALSLNWAQVPQGLSSDSTQTLARAKSDSTSLIDGSELPVVHREHDHREQVITAGVFMGSLLVLLGAMNNFNPRPRN